MVLEFKTSLNSLGIAQNAHHLAAVQVWEISPGPALKNITIDQMVWESWVSQAFDWVQCEETFGGEDGGAVVFVCRWAVYEVLLEHGDDSKTNLNSWVASR